MNRATILVQDLHTIQYALAWQYQQQLFDKALQQKQDKQPTQNQLLLCQHPHTITMGKHAHQENVLYTEQHLAQHQVALFHTDRGGDATYHGPGQVVAYPIFDLETLGIGLRQYIHYMEAAIIATLAHFGIAASRYAGAAGVWLDTDQAHRTRKIAAIGVRSSRFVTMHGLALNVNTDLKYFDLINPCGFADKGVTSMQIELGKEIDIEEVKKVLANEIINIYTCNLKEMI